MRPKEHASVLGILWLRGEDDECGPEWQNRAACNWSLNVYPMEFMGRADLLFEMQAGVDHGLLTCPACAILVDAARALGIREPKP